MARAHSVWLVILNTRPLRAFTVKHECKSYLEREWPKCPTNLRVWRFRDGEDWAAIDVTSALYGLKG